MRTASESGGLTLFRWLQAGQRAIVRPPPRLADTPSTAIGPAG